MNLKYDPDVIAAKMKTLEDRGVELRGEVSI